MRLLLAMLLSALSLKAQGTWDLYYAPHADVAALEAKIKSHLPVGTALKLHELPPAGTNIRQLRTQARAMAAGVTQLPSIVFRDDRGPYAVLPFNLLNAGNIEKAQQLSQAPDRMERAARLEGIARLYLLRSLLCISADAAEQDRAISRLHEIMDNPETEQDTRQFIGMHCLYPALMQQYATEYRGAHTPRTEAKLLEAIQVLETVRDMNPTSHLGRVAYDEREKLRAARLKSRQYE